jgi:hypothetical protein
VDRGRYGEGRYFSAIARLAQQESGAVTSLRVIIYWAAEIVGEMPISNITAQEKRQRKCIPAELLIDPRQWI